MMYILQTCSLHPILEKNHESKSTSSDGPWMKTCGIPWFSHNNKIVQPSWLLLIVDLFETPSQRDTKTQVVHGCDPSLTQNVQHHLCQKWIHHRVDKVISPKDATPPMFRNMPAAQRRIIGLPSLTVAGIDQSE